MAEVAEVKTVEEFQGAPEEFQTMVKKIVRSHAVNELAGAEAYDEPAIKLAPTPYAKWLTCRVAMEEYAHHVRFRELGLEVGLTDKDMSSETKDPLNIMGYDMKTWAEFCVIKMLADLAEILQVEDLLHCTFHPLRNLARSTMPEERFHADFGVEFCTELCKTEQGKKDVQEAVNKIMPIIPSFFGRPQSKNNELYRKWGIKLRKNEEMIADYVQRASQTLKKLGLEVPEFELPEGVEVQ